MPQTQQLPTETHAANGMAEKEAAQQLAADPAVTSAPQTVLRTQEAEHDLGGGNLSAGFRHVACLSLHDQPCCCCMLDT